MSNASSSKALSSLSVKEFPVFSFLMATSVPSNLPLFTTPKEPSPKRTPTRKALYGITALLNESVTTELRRPYVSINKNLPCRVETYFLENNSNFAFQLEIQLEFGFSYFSYGL